MVCRVMSHDPAALARLKRFAHNVEWHYISDYSGYDCPFEALRLLQKALTMSPLNWQVGRLVSLRACDNEPLAQGVLAKLHNGVELGSVDNWEESSGDGQQKTCIFRDINDRLSQATQEALNNEEPRDRSTPQERVAARQRQHAILEDCAGEEFGHGCRSHCLTHNKPCLTLPQVAYVSPSIRKLRFMIAGTCCQGWTSEGHGGRFGHLSERAHSVWSLERKQAAMHDLEDFFVQECTREYPWEVKLAPLEKTHTLIRVLVAPDALGIPARRMRSYVCGISRKSMVWVGPDPSDKDALQAAYDEIFKRQVVATGAAFLNADRQEIEQEHRRRATIQKNHWPQDFDAAGALEVGAKTGNLEVLMETMALGQFKRYEAWEQVRQQQGQGDKDWFSDCEHNVKSRSGTSGKAPAPGPLFPVELRHGAVVAHKQCRHVTHWEKISSHGFHMHETVAQEYGISPYREVLADLTPQEVGKLGGNGMSLPSLESFLLFTLSNCVWVDENQQSVPEIKFGRRGATCFFENTETQDPQDLPQDSLDNDDMDMETFLDATNDIQDRELQKLLDDSRYSEDSQLVQLLADPEDLPDDSQRCTQEEEEEPELLAETQADSPCGTDME